MDPTTSSLLQRLNREFYARHGAEFSATRQAPWSGWRQLRERIANALSRESPRFLDVGCGNGRFFRFLIEEGLAPRSTEYVGVDADRALLNEAGNGVAFAGSSDREGKAIRASLVQRDVLESPLRDGEFGRFDLVVAFGLMHHVPGRKRRAQLVRELASQLVERGTLVISAWRFSRSGRGQERVLSWERAAEVLGTPIDSGLLEPGDVLLSFGNSGAPRYCHEICDEESDEWVAASGLAPALMLYAGRDSSDLNDYLVLGPSPSKLPRR